ncbi:MAG: glycosyltransferase [Cytophagaceae bacterium]|nr:glycosyltransferase [Cytophagaceae bacterium]MDW8455789.1 glycosyltransferase [Cytophagaceae bacterium]
MNKNVLYISYDGMTDQLGQSQVIPYLQGLTKYGYTFSIISCEKKDRYEKDKDLISDILKQSRIDWYPLPYHNFPPVLSTVYDAFKIWVTAEKLHKQKKFSLIHCRSYISSLTGLAMKKKYGVPFLFDMRGFWADERVEGGLWNLKNPLYKWVYDFFKKKEKQFLEHADYTISLTQKGKEEIHTWKHINKQPVPIEVIPCCVDLELFNIHNVKEEDKKNISTQLRLSHKDFVITYLGSIGTWYMLDEMLHFFKQLTSKITDAKFLFITNEEQQLIRQAAHKIGIPDEQIIIHKASRKEVPVLLSLGKYSMFFIKPVYSKMSSSPTKQGEIMAMGIPMIVNDNIGDTTEIIRTYNAGFVLENFSTDTINEIVEQIAMRKPINHTQIREGAKKIYSLAGGVEKYAGVYQLIGKNND